MTDDVPVVLGLKHDPAKVEELKSECIEVLPPGFTDIEVAPVADSMDVLGPNVLRRAARLSTNPSEECIVVVYYGSSTYQARWDDLIKKMANVVLHHGYGGFHSAAVVRFTFLSTTM